jgi:hypothetical protein
MQFAIGVTVLECSFVKHSHSPLGVNMYAIQGNQCTITNKLLIFKIKLTIKK